jgi:hypothetical protein
MIQHPITRKVKVGDEATGEVREETKVLRRGLTRRHINKQIGRIKRMFAWAVEEELVPATVHQALVCVKGLKKGKGEAREKPRVQRVPDAFIVEVLPHLASVASVLGIRLHPSLPKVPFGIPRRTAHHPLAA